MNPLFLFWIISSAIVFVLLIAAFMCVADNRKTNPAGLIIGLVSVAAVAMVWPLWAPFALAKSI